MSEFYVSSSFSLGMKIESVNLSRQSAIPHGQGQGQGQSSVCANQYTVQEPRHAKGISSFYGIGLMCLQQC